MVPPYSIRISRVPTYSSLPTITSPSYKGLSPTMAELSRTFYWTDDRFSNWAGPRSLAATNRISVDFFSSGYLDVSVLRVRFTILCIQIEITLNESWVSPFGNLRINVYLLTPRSLSQAITSFIASYCQGIHRMRLFTYYTTSNDSQFKIV